MHTTKDQAAANPTPLRVNVRFGGGAFDYADLKRVAASKPQAFARFVQDKIADGTFTWDKVDSLPHLFGALADVQIPAQMPIGPGLYGLVTTSAFPLLTGGLTVQRFNERYAALPTIGQFLVRDYNDPMKVSVIARLAGLDNDTGKPHIEGEDYPAVGATEDGVVIEGWPDGRRLSISSEMIRQNRVGDFVRRIDFLAEFAAKYVEKLTISRVCDIKGSGSSPTAPYVYRPLNSSAGTSLYSTTANTPGPRAPSGTRLNNYALVDDTDLNGALNLLMAMRDDNDDPIDRAPGEAILLVPFALLATAQKWTSSELVPGEENSLNVWGPRGDFRPRVLSSPRLDAHSTGAWYYGYPQMQFERKIGLNFEYVTLAGNTESFLTKGVAFQARIAWDINVGATDYVHFVQCLPATTPPT